jgi:hypothetical protein
MWNICPASAGGSAWQFPQFAFVITSGSVAFWAQLTIASNIQAAKILNSVFIVTCPPDIKRINFLFGDPLFIWPWPSAEFRSGSRKNIGICDHSRQERKTR